MTWRARGAALLALLVPVVAWGLSFVSIKAALTEIPPMTLAFARFAVAGLVMGVVVLRRRGPLLPPRADLWPLLASVLTGITAYFLFENHGVQLIPASTASLIIAAIPIVSLLADRWLRSRPLGPPGVAAAATSFAGVALVLDTGGTGGGTVNLTGALLMGGAALSWVAYLFTLGPLQARHDNVVLTTWQMLWGALTLLPLALLESPQWVWPSWAAWGHIAFQGLVCSALSFVLYNTATQRLGVQAASVAVNLIPVVTVAASALWLGETLNVAQVIGGLLVLSAVTLISLTSPTKTP